MTSGRITFRREGSIRGDGYTCQFCRRAPPAGSPAIIMRYDGVRIGQWAAWIICETCAPPYQEAVEAHYALRAPGE